MKGRDALVVGAGSIGSRHRRVLEAMGLRVATVSRRGGHEYAYLTAALADVAPSYVVVATETVAHGGAIAALVGAGFSGRVLVEKPLLAMPAALPAHAFAGAYVGYQLRFHPVVMALRARLEGETVVAATASVGQHLTQWRPGRDLRATYSAHADAGGGVVRDLSHELDNVLWLFGDWQQMTARIVASGTLGIYSDDVASLLLATERCPAVDVALDYHRRPVSRTITVLTAGHTLVADLIAGTLTEDGTPLPVSADQDSDGPYLRMHCAALSDGPEICDFAAGLRVVDLIAAAEAASAQRTWISR